MQTFLPYKNFRKSAQALDQKRLGKQRIECKQILQKLLNLPLENGKPRRGWPKHPAIKMWEGYEYYLCLYGIVICQEWIGRGYKDQQLPIFKDLLSKCKNKQKPHWLGDEEFHRSHQSNLIRKKSEYYSNMFVNIPSDLPYKWPKGANHV